MLVQDNFPVSVNGEKISAKAIFSCKQSELKLYRIMFPNGTFSRMMRLLANAAVAQKMRKGKK